MEVRLPDVVPPSPYPHVTPLKPGQLRALELEGAEALQEAFYRVLPKLPLRNVVALPRQSDGSVTGGRGVIEGLNYWVASGAELELCWLVQRARKQWLRAFSELLKFPIVPLEEPEQQVNVNVLLAGGSYEWHYDPCPITAVLFVTAHPEGGALCYRDRFGGVSKIQPRPGLTVLGDFSQTLHCVEPTLHQPFRISIPMGYGVPGHARASGSDFLYGR